MVKVNVDQNRATAMKYHVRTIPMLLLFKDGQVQATQIGAVGKAPAGADDRTRHSELGRFDRLTRVRVRSVPAPRAVACPDREHRAQARSN